MSRALVLAAAAAVLAGCAAFQPDSGRVVRFIAFGDTGTATAKQYAVGRAIAQVCAERGCDFAILLGDNFYPNGVAGTGDPQWQTKFERPYAALTFPIYAAQGNHDNSRGNGDGSWNQRGMAEVDYHYAPGRTSDKWRMPARYYSFAAPLAEPAPLAEFFALDSSPLSSQPDPDPEWSAPVYAERQFEWLDPLLRRSQARWKIAFAHHPLAGNGRGSLARAPWRQFLARTICPAGVDIFFAGHDHTLQWIKPVPGCDQTELAISGAGAKESALVAPDRYAPRWQRGGALGFFWVELRENELRMVAFVLDRNTLPRNADGTALPAFAHTLER